MSPFNFKKTLCRRVDFKGQLENWCLPKPHQDKKKNLNNTKINHMFTSYLITYHTLLYKTVNTITVSETIKDHNSSQIYNAIP